MSTIGTEICGSSSRGVIAMPRSPIRKNEISSRGVSGDSMKARATRPARPSLARGGGALHWELHGRRFQSSATFSASAPHGEGIAGLRSGAGCASTCSPIRRPDRTATRSPAVSPSRRMRISAVPRGRRRKPRAETRDKRWRCAEATAPWPLPAAAGLGNPRLPIHARSRRHPRRQSRLDRHRVLGLVGPGENLRHHRPDIAAVKAHRQLVADLQVQRQIRRSLHAQVKLVGIGQIHQRLARLNHVAHPHMTRHDHRRKGATERRSRRRWSASRAATAPPTSPACWRS